MHVLELFMRSSAGRTETKCIATLVVKLLSAASMRIVRAPLIWPETSKLFRYPGYGDLVDCEAVDAAGGEVESAGRWLVSVLVDTDDREACATTSDALVIYDSKLQQAMTLSLR